MELLLKSVATLNVDVINVLVNIDGLPPFKSSPGEFYPILLSILNVPDLKNVVVPVGLYYGTEKPFSVDEFLKDFVEEINLLINEGFIFRDSRLTVRIAAFCCDAPAKSYIMGIKGHGGFFSCTRCKVKGQTLQGRRIFTESSCELRTHEDFILRNDLNFQCRDTPLTKIPGIDFVKSFVLDYMHLVCLGVVRTIIVV